MEIYEVTTRETILSVFEKCGETQLDSQRLLNSLKQNKLIAVTSNDLFNGYALIDKNDRKITGLKILPFAEKFGIESELKKALI